MHKTSTEETLEKIPTHITPTRLKGERNWTDGAIRKFLGEPDEFIANPHYRSAAPMRLYTLERVYATESTPEFKEWQQNYLSRKETAQKGAQKAVETKKKELFKKIDKMQVKFPKFKSEGALIRNACAHYNMLWGTRGKEDKCADPQTANQDFLRRITLNYLRHSCTNYDGLLTEMQGRVGINDAIGKLHELIREAAISKYAWLHSE